MKYSAKMLLLEFQVQRNRILNLCAGVFIVENRPNLSLSSVAKRYRPVARILATASARSSIALRIDSSNRMAVRNNIGGLVNIIIAQTCTLVELSTT
jgi:hypothetical protein